MPGSVEGGKKAAATNKYIYGDDYYAVIGAIGGKLGRTGGFASDKVGLDGLTGRARARVAGRVGGKLSKRGASLKKEG